MAALHVGASGVGTPVTRSPCHRPGRAVFPVPRLYSLSREREFFRPRSSLRPQRPPNASSGHPGLIESWLEALTTQGSPAAGPNDDQCRSSSLDWLFPAVRLARGDPVLLVRHVFPVRAAYSRRVLRHVMGFPHRRRLCPIRHPVGLRRSPACLCAPCSTPPPERTPLQGSSPVRVPAQSVSSLHLPQEPSRLPEFSGASLPACHGLSTPADIHTLALTRASSRLPGSVPRRHPRVCDLEAVPALQGARSPLRPTGFSVYACPVSCSRLAPLRNRTNTRYGWVASPYPTGTFTRQETPSFARR